jgi:subtilisin family serine protease
VEAVASRDARVRHLWLSNAIQFRAGAAAVEAIAADKAIAGVMHHDKAYDLLAGVLACRDSKPAAEAAADAADRANAWNIGWIDAPEAWALGYDGTGVVVGHIDSGVYLTHPDIADRLWVNTGETPGNDTDDDGNGYVDDIHGYDVGDDDGNPNDDSLSPGHGTHTAGTVCGDGTNGTITGVAPGATIMAVKAFTGAGDGTLGMIWDGYQYLLVNGARVITMSLGVPGELPPSYMRTERETVDNLRVAGILLFNSAGNEHYEYDPPIELGLTARCPAPWNPIAGTPYTSTSGVVAVGGTGYYTDSPYGSSSVGPVNWGDVAPWYDWPYNPGPGLTKPDVCAPGVNVNSLTIPNGYSGNSWSGTSMSCPHAAGLAALMLHKNPSLSPAGMDSIMEQTAVDLGTAGKDNQYGSGRIDADACVAAVPTAAVPHLTWTSYAIQDDTGDGVIEPGESFDLVFTLVNNSPNTDGTGVAGTLSVEAGDPVTVDDGSGAFGTILQDGGTGDNAGDVFSLTADGGAAQGEVFHMTLTVTAQNGYTKAFDVDYYVGFPEYLTHDVGNVLLTVTDMGSLGFMSSDQIEGVGFGPVDANGLYIGSFWGATSNNYICNHDYDEGSYDWVVRLDPTGRVKDLGDVVSDQDFVAVFDDAGHFAPKDVTVTQESFAWADAPNDDFVVLRYTVHNGGATALNDYYAAVFCDFDIGDASANYAGTGAPRRVASVYTHSTLPYYGITQLGDTPVSNLYCVNNPDEVYPSGYITDNTKFRIIDGFLSRPSGSSGDDWSVVNASGPVDIPAGEEAVFAWALVWGVNEADFVANIDAAQLVDLTGPTPVADGQPPLSFRLAQNTPNPFNPQTEIAFTTEREGHVRLGVYDLKGQLVSVLADRAFLAGTHRVVWNGRSDRGDAMPSGMYLYRVFDGNETITRKMMLVR